MSRVLIVYESMFGNTRRIAEAVAEGLGDAVEVVEVGSAPTLLPEDVDLLVVGAPTHAFGLSRPSTRESAAGQAVDGVVSTGIGVREWLDELRHGPAPVTACAFDTRVKVGILPGSAARKALRRLGKLGFPALVKAESFFVGGTPGPLLDGEVRRAREWGERLAAARRSTTST